MAKRRINATSLTDREKEVMEWVCIGKTNQDVADILGCSMLTVKHHLSRIYKRLSVENRTQAVIKMLYAENQRLRKIEHLVWHLLDDSEERADHIIIDMGDDYVSLLAVLPEEHPQQSSENNHG